MRRKNIHRLVVIPKDQCEALTGISYVNIYFYDQNFKFGSGNRRLLVWQDGGDVRLFAPATLKSSKIPAGIYAGLKPIELELDCSGMTVRLEAMRERYENINLSFKHGVLSAALDLLKGS